MRRLLRSCRGRRRRCSAAGILQEEVLVVSRRIELVLLSRMLKIVTRSDTYVAT